MISIIPCLLAGGTSAKNYASPKHTFQNFGNISSVIPRSVHCRPAIGGSGQCSKPAAQAPNEFGRQLVGDADASAASQRHRVSEEIVVAVAAFRLRGCRLDIERK